MCGESEGATSSVHPNTNRRSSYTTDTMASRNRREKWTAWPQSRSSVPGMRASRGGAAQIISGQPRRKVGLDAASQQGQWPIAMWCAGGQSPYGRWKRGTARVLPPARPVHPRMPLVLRSLMCGAMAALEARRQNPDMLGCCTGCCCRMPLPYMTCASLPPSAPKMSSTAMRTTATRPSSPAT